MRLRIWSCIHDVIEISRKNGILMARRNYSCKLNPQKKYMDIECKVALITGGTTGIGYAAAHELLCRKAKAVVISGPDECSGLEAAKSLNSIHGQGRCSYLALDVKNLKQFEDVVKETQKRFGSMDILFNNAGILNDKLWEDTIDINVKSTIHGTLLALKYMNNNPKPGGVVITNASVLGFDTLPYAPVYNTSNHALVGFTKALGDPVHFQKNNVRIICLCPGVTQTALISEVADKQLTREWGLKTSEAFQNSPQQSTIATGKAVAYMVQYAPPGTLWPCEGNILYMAIPPDRKTFSEKVLDKSLIFGTFLALKYMPKNQNTECGGLVINNAAVTGFDINPYVPVYNASKFAVVGFTRAMGDPVHFCKTNIRIIALCPGFTRTQLFKDAESKLICAEWLPELNEELGKHKKQNAEHVAKALAFMIQFAPPGTCWPCYAKRLYMANPPESSCFSEEVLDLC